MCVNGKGEVQLQNDIISKLEEFKFLGSMIAAEGGSKNEIKVRLAIARSTTVQLAGIWKSGEINLALNVSLAKALVWSVALYGCESWTLKKRGGAKYNIIWNMGLETGSTNQLGWTQNECVGERTSEGSRGERSAHGGKEEEDQQV